MEWTLIFLVIVSGNGVVVAVLILSLLGVAYLIGRAAAWLFPESGLNGELIVAFGSVAIAFGFVLWRTEPDFLSWLFGWLLITILSLLGYAFARWLLGKWR